MATRMHAIMQDHGGQDIGICLWVRRNSVIIGDDEVLDEVVNQDGMLIHLEMNAHTRSSHCGPKVSCNPGLIRVCLHTGLVNPGVVAAFSAVT